MTPTQQAMCHVIKQEIGRFYENPENEQRFQEWKKRRQDLESITRAPSECRRNAERQHAVNLTTSAI